MKELPDFTEKSFLALSLERQHKKCAELLRRIYTSLLQHENVAQAWDVYLIWLRWMQITREKASPSPALVSDYYHEHMQGAKRQLKEHNLLPAIRKGDRKVAEEQWPIYVYLDNIRSAHNVGSILRTAEAFGLAGVYFSDKTPFIDHRQVQQTAMGCAEWLTCKHADSLESLPKPLLVLETSEQAHSIYSYPFPNSFTLALGNEEYGCSESVLQKADAILNISLRGRKNSLNVANAFAIAVSEINRMRTTTFKQRGSL